MVLGRRAIDIVVLFFALYAFAFVPLGRMTGLEHLRAILRTHAAKDAEHEVVEAGDRLRQRLLNPESEEPIRAHGHAGVPKLPKHEAPANARLTWPDAPDASL